MTRRLHLFVGFSLVGFTSIYLILWRLRKRKSLLSEAPPLTQSQVDEFLREGVLVVPSVLSKKEVDEARRGLHAYLCGKGVDVNDLVHTANGLQALSTTNGSGGILNIFYPKWKFKVMENRKIFDIVSQLWAETYAKGDQNPLFSHPYGPFDPSRGYGYVDRVGFRVPSSVALAHCEGQQSSQTGKKRKKRPLQRSLTPHLDCCPHELYHASQGGKQVQKWRPIQCFVALTDTLDPELGGFECARGFIRSFDQWVAKRPGSSSQGVSVPPPCKGEFTPIRPIEDREVLQRIAPVACKAGDLVLWDWRTPHANSRENLSRFAREVIYLGYLPAVPVNEAYSKQQLERMRVGMPPDDQWNHYDTSASSNCTERPELDNLTPFGLKLLGIIPWT